MGTNRIILDSGIVIETDSSEVMVGGVPFRFGAAPEHPVTEPEDLTPVPAPVVVEDVPEADDEPAGEIRIDQIRDPRSAILNKREREVYDALIRLEMGQGCGVHFTAVAEYLFGVPSEYQIRSINGYCTRLVSKHHLAERLGNSQSGIYSAKKAVLVPPIVRASVPTDAPTEESPDDDQDEQPRVNTAFRAIGYRNLSLPMRQAYDVLYAKGSSDGVHFGEVARILCIEEKTAYHRCYQLARKHRMASLMGGGWFKAVRHLIDVAETAAL